MITLIYLIAMCFLCMQTISSFYRAHQLREEYAGQGGYIAYAKTAHGAARVLGANALFANWFLAAAVGHYLFG